MVVANKDKRERKKGNEGRGFGRLPSFYFPSFLFVFSRLFLVVILVQIWLCFLCFEDSISFEFLKFTLLYILHYFTLFM